MNNKTNIDYNNPVLEVENLKQYFKVGLGRNKLFVRAVDGISFNVYKREVFGIVGESGCGKTTAGRSIMRLYNPTNGLVKLNGNVIGAGYGDILDRINSLKKERKIKLIDLNNLTKFYYEKDQVLLSQIRGNLFQIYSLKDNFFRRTKEITKELDEYNNIIFELTNQYKIALQKNLTTYKITRKDLLAKTFNVFEKEYNQIYKRTKNSLKMKLKGVSDSSALTKNTKQELYASIKSEYELKFAKIKEEYSPKIEEYSSKIINKNDVKNLLIDAKQSYLEMRQALKDDFDVQVSQVKKPSQKTIGPIIKTFFKSFGLRIKFLFQILWYALNRIIPSKTNLIRLYRKVNFKLPTPETINSFITYDNNLAEIKKLKKEISLVKKLAKKENIDKKEEIDKLVASINELVTLNKQITKDLLANRHSPETYKALKQAYLQKKVEVTTPIREEILELKTKIKETKKLHSSKTTKFDSRNMQMIFQDPIASLNPRMTVKEIIAEGLIVNGTKDKKEIQQRVLESMELVGLSSDYLTRYPHEFSGGQRQRIGIARALVMRPSLIIADEPVSALDVSIQAQVINLLRQLKDDLGLTIVFVAHDLSVVKFFCDRIAVMYYGKIVELASSDELFRNPLHPYTKSLLSAIPQPDPDYEKNRKRIYYSPTIHNYEFDKPSLTEITTGHFVYANSAELEEMKKELKQ